MNQSSQKSSFLFDVGVFRYVSLLPSWWKWEGCVVTATDHSGTVTLLRSGLMKTSARGPKIAEGSESLKGLDLAIAMKSFALTSPQIAGTTPPANHMGKNCALRMPPVYTASSYRSASVPIAIIALRCGGRRLATAC